MSFSPAVSTPLRLQPPNLYDPMSQKPNPTSIGLFIVVGVALGVTGLLLFSSAKLFSPRRDAIVYFNESLNGLKEGAPVKYRGVTIG